MGLGSMSTQYSPAPTSRRLPRSSSGARPRQRGTATATAASCSPAPSSPAAEAPAAPAASTASAPPPPPAGTLRRGRSLDVICEEVLGEAPLLTNPVRRRRSELIPRARLIPRRAASETRADSRTRARSAVPEDAASPAPSVPSASRTPSLAAVRRCSSVRSEEGGAWGATYWRPSASSATRRSNSLCCSPGVRTPERPQRASSARRSHSARLEAASRAASDGGRLDGHPHPAGPFDGHLDGRLGHRHSACTTPAPQSQRCSRSNSYRCPAPSPFKDPVADDADGQGDAVEAGTTRAAAAAAATAVAAAAAITAMTRRPQVLRITDSATTSSSRKVAAFQPGSTSPQTPSTMSPQLSPVDSPQDTPRPAARPGSPAPATPAQQRTYVSQSSVTLRGAPVGVPVYDEYLCADHRWGRQRAGSEEDLCANSCSSGSSSSSYVTWTKSSLRSTQWQLLHSGAGAAPPAQPVSSCMLKNDGELPEAGGDAEGDGCVAVLAPCPAASAAPAPAVSLLPLPKAAKQARATARATQKRGRHYDSRTEFDGLLQYLQDYRHGLRELLVNNNVVIIEPVRASQAKRHSVDERDGLDRRAHSAPGEDHRDAKTCRITGAIIKPMCSSDSEGGHVTRSPSTNNTLPRSQKPHQPILRRQFFYHPIKINKELVDEELPDPDTVRNARKVFERAPPLGAKGVGLAGLGLGLGRDKRCWTDSGSLSSGVSSDLSCCGTSCHTSCHASCDTDHLASGSTDSQLDQRDAFSSGDESEPDHPKQQPPPPPPAATPVRGVVDAEAQGNPVSEDVLKKIRACGTTVTYFGGEVIACSGAGPVRSPMTMAIMEEIRRSARPITLGLGASLGIKFRLVKSNSCGSRLELAGQTAGGHGGRWVRANASPTPPRPRRGSAEREVNETIVRNPTLRPDDTPAAPAAPATKDSVSAASGGSVLDAHLPDGDLRDDEHLIIDDFHISAAQKTLPQNGVSRNGGATTTPQNGVSDKIAVQSGATEKNRPQNGISEKAGARNSVPVVKAAAHNGIPEKVKPHNVILEKASGEDKAAEDKENRPGFTTTWKMAAKDAKRPVIHLPVAPPPQPDKFGVMEFEEFQFIDS